MLRHFECFPLVWEILRRHNVPVEHLPPECVRRWVYCNVSVLESWKNEMEGRKKERGGERKVTEGEKTRGWKWWKEQERQREREIKEGEEEGDRGSGRKRGVEAERGRPNVREREHLSESFSLRVCWFRPTAHQAPQGTSERSFLAADAFRKNWRLMPNTT